MRAINIPRPGGPEVLEVGERPTPTPDPSHVLIRMEAATVNPTDVPAASSWGGRRRLSAVDSRHGNRRRYRGNGTGRDFLQGQRVFGVLQALRRLRLPRGATLGVIGSAGAVGQYAIQLGATALPMEQIQYARRRLEAGGVRGRIVITA